MLARDLVVAQTAELACRAATSAPTEGRPLYAGLRVLPEPTSPVARLWRAATLLREHRGDSHNAVLLSDGIAGSEAHVLLALSWGMAAEDFDRLHHLPRAQIAAVVEGLRVRTVGTSATGADPATAHCRRRRTPPVLRRRRKRGGWTRQRANRHPTLVVS